MQTELASLEGSSIKGVIKTVGFLFLSLLFAPVDLIVRTVRRKETGAITCLFYKMIVKLIDIRVREHGEIAGTEEGSPPVLYVSNHTSYLDIMVLGSLLDGSFVAKSEVRSWPIIGWIARSLNTVFIERRSIRAAVQNDVLRDRLESGSSLILFPEGTSTDGQRTLPFKSSLFGIVEKPLADGRYALVQPISTLPTEIGGLPIGRAWRPYYTWFGDMTLVKHVWEFFKIGAFTVDVIFHAPVTMAAFETRKLLAEHCQEVVAAGVDRCITGRFENELA